MIKVRSGGAGAAGVIGELTRFTHCRAMPNSAFTNDFVYPAGALPSALGPAFAVAGVPTRVMTDSRRCWRVFPSLVAGQWLIWKNLNAAGAAAEQPAPMRDDAKGVEVATPAGQAFATVCQAWLRKDNNVNICTARQFFGFANNQAVNNGADARTSRVGVYGDGANGFRLGSQHCPDAQLNPAQSAQNDTDAGFVQPAVLLNPGLKWFHVKVKLVPATPSTPPAVGIYLDGALQVSFFTVANFPRGNQGVNRDYQIVEATLFAEFDAVTQLNGWQMSEFEIWYDTDLSL